MLKLTPAVVLLGFSAAALGQQFESGLSGSVIAPKRETVTDWLLEQQRSMPAPTESELPASLYVDSQRRIANTFSTAVPDSLQEKANSTRNTK
ncbi:hypothetical protein [Isoalcanivorax beigongshangi]|uniref:DUF3613 domain-containing protein n=1 Tax=Isoalcanivorax beigongshangi TaxID=3238810 RepID=A0ABV4ACI1_9GAMM